jgi:hypothetical protein
MTIEYEYEISAELMYERGAEFSAPLKAEYFVFAENEIEAVENFLIDWENQPFFTVDQSTIKIKQTYKSVEDYGEDVELPIEKGGV